VFHRHKIISFFAAKFRLTLFTQNGTAEKLCNKITRQSDCSKRSSAIFLLTNRWSYIF